MPEENLDSQRQPHKAAIKLADQVEVDDTTSDATEPPGCQVHNRKETSTKETVLRVIGRLEQL